MHFLIFCCSRFSARMALRACPTPLVCEKSVKRLEEKRKPINGTPLSPLSPSASWFMPPGKNGCKLKFGFEFFICHRRLASYRNELNERMDERSNKPWPNYSSAQVGRPPAWHSIQMLPSWLTLFYSGLSILTPFRRAMILITGSARTWSRIHF